MRGTVRSVSSDKNQFLRDLPCAERLELVAADLNDAESFKVWLMFTVEKRGCVVLYSLYLLFEGYVSLYLL
mgnify:CR=1 FL=1